MTEIGVGIIVVCTLSAIFAFLSVAADLGFPNNTKDDLLMSAHEARNLNRNKKQIIAELKWINKKISKRASHGYTHYFNLDVDLHQETIDELKKKGYNVQTSKLGGYNLISWKE